MSKKYRSSDNPSGGMGFFPVLGLIFIVLKLCKVITWSWLWVLCPIWIPLSLYLGIAVGIILWFSIKAAIKKRKKG